MANGNDEKRTKELRKLKKEQLITKILEYENANRKNGNGTEKNEGETGRVENVGRNMVDGSTNSNNKENARHSNNELEKVERHRGKNGSTNKSNGGILIKGKTEIGIEIFAKGRTTEEAVIDVKRAARAQELRIKSLWERREMEWVKL